MSFTLRLLILSTIILIVEFYFFKKLFNSIRNVKPGFSVKYKWTRRIVITFLNLFAILYISYLIIAIVFGGGRGQVPQNVFFDYLILYPFWIFILTVLQSMFILIPIDILKLISYPFWRKYRELVRKYTSVLALIIIAASTIYVPVRVIWDLNAVAVRVTGYDLKNVTTKFKIILIADTQADWYTDTDRLNNYIEKVNSAEPDLVLVAGDIITSSPDYIDAGAEALGKIKSKYGVYTCVGDHDNWAYRGNVLKSRSEVKDALSRNGIRMLDNENLILDIDSVSVRVTAVTETYSDRISIPELNRLTNHNGNEKLKIFLTHQPRPKLIDKAIEKNYNLFFAGHTHGGQITFLFPFKNLSVTHFETNYVKGDFWFGNMMMIINRGLGMSLSPVRYNSTPEVTVVNVH